VSLAPADRGPVREFIHSCRASSNAVIFALKLEVNLAFNNLNLRGVNYFGIVSMAIQLSGTIASVLKFFPTLGRLKIGCIPTSRNSEGSPMPEFRSICGVPITPAERISSFKAVS
jgi:hypothetical protein